MTITDGEENASRELSRGKVVELVRAKAAEGWTFAFLGAGLDAYSEAGAIGYHAGSVQSFAPDADGADLAFRSLSDGTRLMRRRVRRGERINVRDFFGEFKPAEADRERRHST